MDPRLRIYDSGVLPLCEHMGKLRPSQIYRLASEYKVWGRLKLSSSISPSRFLSLCVILYALFLFPSFHGFSEPHKTKLEEEVGEADSRGVLWDPHFQTMWLGDVNRDYTKHMNKLGKFIENISVILDKISNHSVFLSLSVSQLVLYWSLFSYLCIFASTKMGLTLLSFNLLKEISWNKDQKV